MYLIMKINLCVTYYVPIIYMVLLHNYIISVFIFCVTIMYYKFRYTNLVSIPIEQAYYHIIIYIS